MPFLFSKTMAQRAFYIYYRVYSKTLASEGQVARAGKSDFSHCTSQNLSAKKAAVDASLEVYDFFCQKYFGLGFVASFIPGTEAFLARKILSGAVDQLSNMLIGQLKTYRKDLWKDPDIVSLRGPIVGTILGTILSLLLIIMRVALDSYRYGGHRFNRKTSFKELGSYFPGLCDIYCIDHTGVARLNPYLVANLIHTLCNPVRLVEAFLSFLHLAINRVIEIGSEERQESRAIRKGLKGFAGIVFSAINIPVKIVSAIVDIPYQVLKNFIYAPLKFFASALKKKNNDEDHMIVKEDDAAVINVLAGKAIRQIKSKSQGIVPLQVTTPLEAALGGVNTAKTPKTPISFDTRTIEDAQRSGSIRCSQDELSEFRRRLPRIRLSPEFSIFKLTPVDKERMSKCIKVVHSQLPEEDKVDAVRTVLVATFKVGRA